MRADVPTTVATILKNYPSARHSADSHKRLTTKQGNYCAHAGLVHNVCVLPSRNQRSVTDSESTRQVDAVMAAARVLVGVVAQSIADVEDQVTLPQLRVLVMVATRGPLNLATVAEGLGVHASNATRTVDRLVAAKLIDRRDAADDRRNVSITLTRSGQRLVDAVFEQRRSAIEAVLDRMPESKRRALPNALESFAAAAGEAPEQHPNTFQWNQ